eukprot:354893-Chlamydomonas_euryale.AAC.7
MGRARRKTHSESHAPRVANMHLPDASTPPHFDRSSASLSTLGGHIQDTSPCLQTSIPPHLDEVEREREHVGRPDRRRRRQAGEPQVLLLERHARAKAALPQQHRCIRVGRGRFVVLKALRALLAPPQLLGRQLDALRASTGAHTCRASHKAARWCCWQRFRTRGRRFQDIAPGKHRSDGTAAATTRDQGFSHPEPQGVFGKQVHPCVHAWRQRRAHV